MNARIVGAVTLLCAAGAFAQAVPQQITFTGNLNSSGMAVSGPHSFTFALFDAATAGTQRWTEPAQTITVTGGMVYATLGATTPIAPSVLNGPLYLQVTVDAVALSPRAVIQSVPYAVRSTTADTLGTLAPVDLQRRVVGTCTGSNAMQTIDATGAVTCVSTQGGTGDITSVNVLANGGLTGGGLTGDVNLGLMSCAAGQVLKASGPGTWGCSSDLDTQYTAAASGGLVLAAGAFGLSTSGCTASGMVLKYTGTGWACQSDNNSGGTVTQVATGAGLAGGPITGSGTISIANGGVSNAMLASPSLSVAAGTGLTGGGSVALGGTTTLGLATPVAVANGGTGLATGPTATTQFLRGNAAGTAWTNGPIAAQDLPPIGPGMMQPYVQTSSTLGANVTCAAPCWTYIYPAGQTFTLPANAVCMVNMQLEIRASLAGPIMYDTAADMGDVFWVAIERAGAQGADFGGSSGLPRVGSIPTGERRTLSRQAIFTVGANQATRFACGYYNTAPNSGRVFNGANSGLQCTINAMCF
jgi:hypothetical protein